MTPLELTAIYIGYKVVPLELTAIYIGYIVASLELTAKYIGYIVAPLELNVCSIYLMQGAYFVQMFDVRSSVIVY